MTNEYLRHFYLDGPDFNKFYSKNALADLSLTQYDL